MRRGGASVLQRRIDRHRLAVLERYLVPRLLGVDAARIRARCGRGCARCAATAWRRPRSRWRSGISTPASAASRCRGRSAARARRSRRACRSASRTRWRSCSSGSRSSAPPAISASRSRSSRAGTWTSSSACVPSSATMPLMVDANAAYTLADADHLARLDAFGLMMIEQPLDEEDVRDHAVLQAAADGRRSASTSRSSRPGVAQAAIESGRLPHRQHQAGPAGRVQPNRSRRTTSAQRRGVPVWHGGMLESGIGRAHNIHLASLPNFSLPGDIAASRRYFQPDLIEPPIEVAPDGTIPVPTGAGHRRDDRHGARGARDRAGADAERDGTSA